MPVPYLVQVYAAKENQAVQERRKVNLIHIHHRDAHGEIGIILKENLLTVRFQCAIMVSFSW